MKRASKLLALVAANVLAAAPAAAHERADRAMGVVESVTAERIVVKASDGHALSFTLTPQTRFLRGKKPSRAEDVRVGERAVVHGKKAGERIEAVEVKLGASGAAK
jgi:Domain of unknown function (DUF5666)